MSPKYISCVDHSPLDRAIARSDWSDPTRVSTSAPRDPLARLTHKPSPLVASSPIHYITPVHQNHSSASAFQPKPARHHRTRAFTSRQGYWIIRTFDHPSFAVQPSH
ncbi:hypothetical protein PCASD_03593 [Puccinia coronata f. sp. avenae]|uniref:Uncharacterized protein n=1 Tax=Puccinia coronata f. sp. avenae TaxID=200324 RepID=A0A2N5VDJ9_9BASI|nr:hypothetical protein PCASD_03593 [Puccinia coronata f. sp. avenae]